MTRTGRGFTLIEVLLAVFIIGLGAIGLFALFAGVAEQQRRASEMTQSVGITQTVIGMLRADRVGPLEEPGDLSAIPPFSVPHPDPAFGEPLRADSWYPAFIYDTPDDPQYGYTLTIAPRDRSAPDQSRYFLVDADEVEVYTNPARRVGNTFVPFSGSAGVAPAWNAGSDFNGVNVLELSDRRIEPGSVRVTFFASNQLDGTERTLAVFDDLDLVTADPPLTPRDYDIAELRNPAFPSAVVGMNYALLPWNAAPTTVIGLREFNLTGVTLAPQEWVSSIRIRYRYRNDRLLSLTDRLATVPDTDAVGGQRAEFGSTVLYRRTGAGSTQIAVLTYSVRPVGRGGRFVPPERFADFSAGRGLLREVEVRVGFDDDAQLYYIEPIRGDQGFLARTDQIILVAGERRSTGTLPPRLDTLGADQPVRVTRVVGDPADPTAARLYLNEAPRAGFRAINGRRDATVNVNVFALADSVVSLDDRGTRWLVRPVEMRVFDIR